LVKTKLAFYQVFSPADLFQIQKSKLISNGWIAVWKI